MSVIQASRRVFRPKWWSVLLTLAFVVLTVRLGHWQGDRAAYKIEQQRQLDASMLAPPLDLWSSRLASIDAISAVRYRAVTLVGEFDPEAIFLVDNRIQEGKAGYAVLQRFKAIRSTDIAADALEVLVERGWIAAPLERTRLPDVDTPKGRVEITGRINLPRSRNPGTVDNDATSKRINYVNISELQTRTGIKFEPYIIDQTSGTGFIAGTERAAPSFGHQKNLAYQVQWYAFAALAVVLFLYFSFRRIERN